jgi:hypothetical protein
MNKEFKILSTNEDDKKIWDNFVSSSSNVTIFHKAFWLDTVGDSFDICGLYNGSDLIAGFVAPYNKFLGAKRISSPYLTPYTGIVFRKYEGRYVKKISAEKKLAMELAVFLKKRYKWGVLSFDPLIMDMQPFMLQGFKVRLTYTYILDISDIEKTWEEVERKKRTKIRKAEKDGLIVIETYSFDEIIQVLEKTYLRNNWKFPRKLLYQFYNELNSRNLYKGFLCVDGNGNKIAAALITWDEKRAYFVMQGYDEEKKHTGASSLCIWKAITFASQELSLKEFDFGGFVTPQFEEPKRKFGGKLTPYYEVRWGTGLDLMRKVRIFLNKHFKL